MTTSTTRRRGRPAAVIAGALTTLLLVFAVAAPTSASINVTPPTPPATLHTGGTQVTVSGTSPYGNATHFTVAQCGIVVGLAYVAPGTHCSSVSASAGFVALGGGGTYSVANFTLDQEWSSSSDYTTNPPGSNPGVDCAYFNGAQDICVILVSYYNAPNYPAGPITQLGYEMSVVAYEP